MRWIAFLFLLSAAALGAIWPWAQMNFLGQKGQGVSFGNLAGPVPERQTINLDTRQNPVRIRFQARYEVDASLPPRKIPVEVRITDAEGSLLEGIISFPTGGIETGPERPKVRASTPLNFNVINDGPHMLSLSLAPNSNDGGIQRPGIQSIEATVVANAPVIRDDFKALSAALALAGVYLLVRSRGRGKRKNKRPVRKNPGRWGRGD